MGPSFLASSARLLKGPFGDWAFTIALSCFLGWAILFVADEPSERFQGIGMIISLVILTTVRLPRLRRARENGEPHTAEMLPTWHRRMTPVVLAAGAALLLAVTVLGYWWAAAYVAIGVGGGYVTLITHPSKASRSLATWERRTAFVLLATAVASLFAALLGGLWVAAVIATLALVLAVVTIAVDAGRRRRTHQQGAPAR